MAGTDVDAVRAKVQEQQDPYADLVGAQDPYADLTGQQEPQKELEQTPFPEKKGTSQASIQLPEVASVGLRKFLPPEDTLAQGAKNSGVTAATMMTSDPAEIAQILTAQNPDVGLEYAPDGTVIAVNNANGARAVINRPGISYMDVLQGLGLAVAFTPAGRVASAAGLAGREVAKKAITETARKAALKKATAASAGSMAAGSGLTEGAMQEAQQMAGGEFNAGDVALSTAAGALPEYLAQPVTRLASKVIPSSAKDALKVLPTWLGGTDAQAAAEEVAPTTVTQALQYAEQTGKKIATSDALAEHLTPAMNIFFKMAERIPITGVGSQRVLQQAQRADTLTELAHKYNINVDTEVGKDIADSFITRMVKQRFFGKNQNPTPEMMERAWKREGDSITDGVLKKYVRDGNIDEDVVDKLLDSGRSTRIQEMYGKLTLDGQKAARQRFMAKALGAAGWRPEAPKLSDPTAFAAYLNKPESRKAMSIMFSPIDQEVLSGAREYLRLTAKAQTTGKGAGMAAAMAGGAGFVTGFLGDVIGAGAVTGVLGRAVESDYMRNQFLRLAHAKGNEKATQAVMDELRPLLVAVGDQWRQKGYDLPSFEPPEITQEMVKKEGTVGIEALRRGSAESVRSIADLPKHVLNMLGY